MIQRRLTRRRFLAGSATLAAATGLPIRRTTAAEPDESDELDKNVDAKPTRLGIAIASYGMHARTYRAEGFGTPLKFLEFCHQRGAGGVQVPIRARDAADAARIRAQAEAWDMYLEGTIRPPRDGQDVERFDADVRAAKEAGASVLRTALLSGRRYETFASAEEFRRFANGAFRSLELAEPVVRRHGVQLAVENHKDFRTSQLADLVRRIDSEHVGVCVDTGNNLALLEDPMATVDVLAPWAVSTHLKDMAVAEYADGLLLAEVPLGKGFLDLPRVVRRLRKARPAIRFNLEMITRDPLKIPCLTEKYWATFETLPARHLAAALAMVRQHAADKPLARVNQLAASARLAREDENVRQSLAYAREHLGM